MRRTKQRDKLKAAFKGDNSLVAIHDELKNASLTLDQLKFLDKKLLEKYLVFFFSKSTSEQLKDILQKKSLTDNRVFDILNICIGMNLEDVFPTPDECKFTFRVPPL